MFEDLLPKCYVHPQNSTLMTQKGPPKHKETIAVQATLLILQKGKTMAAGTLNMAARAHKMAFRGSEGLSHPQWNLDQRVPEPGSTREEKEYVV